MAEYSLTLQEEEKDYLVSLLERVLKDTRVEEHRTRTPQYRQHVLHEEERIVGLLEKLGRRAGQGLPPSG